MDDPDPVRARGGLDPGQWIDGIGGGGVAAAGIAEVGDVREGTEHGDGVHGLERQGVLVLQQDHRRERGLERQRDVLGRLDHIRGHLGGVIEPEDELGA